MPSYEIGDDFAPKVAEVLGLDATWLRGITISIHAGEVVVVTTQHLIRVDRAERLVELLADYELVLRRSTSDEITPAEADA